MKLKTIHSILQGRKKEMEKYLARSKKDRKDIEKEKYLAHAPEMIEMISHQIGYMTGAIEQTKEFLRMIDITDKEYFKQKEEVKKHNKAVLDQLKKAIKGHGKIKSE